MNRTKSSQKPSEIIDIRGKKYQIIWNKPRVIRHPCSKCGKSGNVPIANGKIVEIVE
jgi:hypothetical protein